MSLCDKFYEMEKNIFAYVVFMQLQFVNFKF